jgi:hypothetical protein
MAEVHQGGHGGSDWIGVEDVEKAIQRMIDSAAGSEGEIG